MFLKLEYAKWLPVNFQIGKKWCCIPLDSVRLNTPCGIDSQDAVIVPNITRSFKRKVFSSNSWFPEKRLLICIDKRRSFSDMQGFWKCVSYLVGSRAWALCCGRREGMCWHPQGACWWSAALASPHTAEIRICILTRSPGDSMHNEVWEAIVKKKK